MPATQTDFPLLLTDALAGRIPAAAYDTDLGTPAQAGGGDLLLSSDAGGTIRLPLDVRACQPAPGGGPFQIRLGMPTASAGDVVYLWWGSLGTPIQPAPGAPFGQHSVYPASVRGLWAMDSDPTGPSPPEIDRTQYGNDASNAGGLVSGDLVPAKIGQGIDLKGASTDRYALSTQTALRTATQGDHTFAVWTRIDVDKLMGLMSTTPTGGAATGGSELIYSSGRIGVQWRTVTGTGLALATLAPSTSLRFVVFSRAGTQGYIWIDGSPVALAADIPQGGDGTAPTAEAQLGSAGNPGVPPWDGLIDEARIIAEAWDDNAVAAHYNNEASDTFATNDGVTVLAQVAAAKFPYRHMFQ
ncbi:MAG: LamG-like jellyroll fold domain-containing protein [Planctomycetota bacterium]